MARNKAEKRLARMMGHRTSQKGEKVEITGIAPTYLNLLKLPWYFEKTYEKIFLIVVTYLGLWKLWEILVWVL